MNNQVTIYTDGAAKGNPGPGGYGLILQSGPHYKEVSEGFRLTTNNRMELLSVIIGLEMLKIPCEVTVYSDSKYVVDAVEKRWIDGWVKRGWKNVKNPDLWKRYLAIASKHKVRFKWIKGHNGHPMNERCDYLAVEASMGKNLKVDTWYEANRDA
ncbi:MAG TPA: ribonuclease HI [Flavobacteriales bacterium]